MSSAKVPIVIFGATGYIGGSVLARLLSHPDAHSFDITIFIRDPAKAKVAEEKFGLKYVIGTLAEEDKIEALAEKAHIVFSCADADDLKSVKAILRGLKSRHAATGDLPILIHTSGTGVLNDNAKGMYATETIYDDFNADQIEALPDTQLHRDVDVAVVEADKQGYLKSYIIVPATIYGKPVNPLVEIGFQKTVSIQIPILIKVSIARGQGCIVGKGLSIWSSVDIDEVTDLYILLFDAILANPDKVGHGREGYFFAENGEHVWYDICKEITKSLFEFGHGNSDEPTALTSEECLKFFGTEDGVGTNSRCRGNRSRSLGWKPVKTTKDMLASIKPEVELILKAQGHK